MKNLMNVKGAKTLNKSEQKSINGSAVGNVCYKYFECNNSFINLYQHYIEPC